MAKNKAEKNVIPTAGTVVDIAKGKKGLKKAKPKKPKKEKVKRERKKASSAAKLRLSWLLPVVIVLIILILAAAFYFSTFYYDVFGLREPIFSYMHSLDPEYDGVVEREAAVAVREAQLDAYNEELLTLRDELETQKLRQQKESEEILQAQKSRVPVYRPPVNETDREYMQGIGKIYSAMEPENAAEIMVNLLTLEDMAAILYFMSTAKAAAIMENMDAQLAAQITDQWINTYSY